MKREYNAAVYVKHGKKPVVVYHKITNVKRFHLWFLSNYERYGWFYYNVYLKLPDKTTQYRVRYYNNTPLNNVKFTP